MKLYLLRHGEAASHAATDSLRPLTALGVHQTQAVVARVAAHMGDLQAIYSSPKLRAQQTAGIVWQYLTKELEQVLPNVVESDAITPSSDITQLGQIIDQHNDTDVLLVTHQPFVGHLIDYLTDQPGLGYEMGTSCLACIDLIAFGRGCGTLQWLERP